MRNKYCKRENRIGRKVFQDTRSLSGHGYCSAAALSHRVPLSLKYFKAWLSVSTTERGLSREVQEYLASQAKSNISKNLGST
jgi:hypothetical protein